MVQSYTVILVLVPIILYMPYKEGTIQIGPIYELSIPIASEHPPERFLICNEGVIISQFWDTQSF